MVILARDGETVADPITVLEGVAEQLGKRPWVQSVKFLSSASVPVVKAECGEAMGYVKLDVTIQDAKHKGLKCVEIVKEFMKQYPQLEPLMLVFKYILRIIELNDPYKVRSQTERK